jgi:hypothetical protein
MRAKDIEVVKTLLKRPIAFHWSLAMMCESVHAGLMLSQAIYWSERTEDPEGWFYKTRTDWFKELCLGRYEQETAREILRERGFVVEELKGNPAKMHYQVHIEAVYSGLLKLAGKQPTRKAAKQPTVNQPSGGGKAADKLGEKQPTETAGKQPTIYEQRLPETSSGTTTETTAPAPDGALPGVTVLLPLNNGREYPITEDLTQELAKLYPAVDVAQEMRGMRAWLLTNPANRKTSRGVLKFANSWLSKEQNRAKSQANFGRSNSERPGATGGAGAKRSTGAYTGDGTTATRFAERKPDLVF